MGTGSDTRMYAPRSESMLGWTKDDDDYRHGIGDPETMERMRDKKMKEKDTEMTVSQLPHLKIENPTPEEPPEMLPEMEEEEEENPMADQYQEGNQLSAMTGMPDTGNLSIGNATGTMPQPGGTLMTGEPMDDAWSSLLKEEEDEEINEGNEGYEVIDPDEPGWDYKPAQPRRKPPIDLNAEINRYRKKGLRDPYGTGKVGEIQGGENVVQTRNVPEGQNYAPFNEETYFTTGEPMGDAWSSLLKKVPRLDKVKRGQGVQPWKQPSFKIQPGGADISTATSRRAKLHSRFLAPSKKKGLMHSPLSVHMSNLGVATKQPLKLFPEKYGQQMGSMQRRKLMGNVPQIPAGHAMGPETTYSPRTPKVAGGAGLKITEPRAPKMTGSSFAKSEDLEVLKKDLEQVQKKMEYMHFAQIRRLLRQMKEAAEKRERRLKSAVSAGVGEVHQAGHREAQNSTTKPEGATENLNSEDDPKNWGASGSLFVGRGSGRVG